MWTIKQLVEYTTLSKATVYRMIKLGRLPKGVRVGIRRTAWDPEAVKTALNNSQTAQ